MERMIRRVTTVVLTLIVSVSVSACWTAPSERSYTSWGRPDASEEEFQADRSWCIGQTTETVWTGTRRGGPRQARWVNEDAYVACMEDRGWQKQ
jgi:hypothetical protein